MPIRYSASILLICRSLNIHFDIPRRVQIIQNFCSLQIYRYTLKYMSQDEMKAKKNTPQKNIIFYYSDPTNVEKIIMLSLSHTIFLYGFPNFIDCITFDDILMEWVIVSNVFFFLSIFLSPCRFRCFIVLFIGFQNYFLHNAFFR